MPPLADAFTRYLRDRDREHGPMAAVLAAYGYALEAALLARRGDGRAEVEDGVWAGRRALIGTMLPPDAAAGDIWFDVVELMPMLPLARDPAELAEYTPAIFARMGPFVSWLALRPVARWQLAAVEGTAPNGDETAPAGPLTYGVAGRYADWFGKSLATRFEWEAARATLTKAEFAALWAASDREWDGLAVADGVYSVVSPDTIDADTCELLDDDDGLTAPDRILFDSGESPPATTFRTKVRAGSPLATGPDRVARG